MDYYPNWLSNDLLNDNLPWDQALPTTMRQFLSQYTFHDSHWISLYLQPQRNAICVIRWDTFWTEGKVPFPGSRVAQWPLLLIRLTGLLHADIDLWESAVQTGISGAESARIGESERVGWGIPAHHPTDYTRIRDFDGGIAHLVHAPPVSFLCMSRDRQVLAIPMGEN